MPDNALFTFTSKSSFDTGITHAEINLNAGHAIFDGHFPGQPVLPGVCMLQMVKKVLEIEKKQKLMLKKADSMKFLSLISPAINRVFQLELKTDVADELYKVEARLLNSETVFFKFKGTFIQLPV